MREEKTCSCGYTIVELLVSAVILVIAVIAVIAIVRKGRELQVVDNHRREARAILNRLLEGEFDYRNFTQLSDDSVFWADTLDTRDGNLLIADVSRRVTSAVEAAQDGDTMTVRKVDAYVRWVEPGGDTEQVTLSKWLSYVP